jgi:hypothetical protein
MSATIPTLQLPPFESPFLEEYLAAAALAPELKNAIRDFAKKGYFILDLDMPDFDEVAATVIEKLAPHYPAKDRRVEEAWYFCEEVRRIAVHDQILDVLRLLYQREPIPFQTLNFDAATQQPAHSDALHFHSIPRHYMCGVWVALEDIDGDCGPLFVHPGSHRLPDIDMFDLGLPSQSSSYHGYEESIRRLMRTCGFETLELHLKKGQAAVWAANLFHGGMPMKDKTRTRHSQASHYYFSDCMYYMPMETDVVEGRMTLREVIDLKKREFVPHRYRGHDVPLRDHDFVWQYARPLPAFVQRADDSTVAVTGSVDGESRKRRVMELERVVERCREDNQRQAEHIEQLERHLADIHASMPYKITKSFGRLLGKR